MRLRTTVVGLTPETPVVPAVPRFSEFWTRPAVMPELTCGETVVVAVPAGRPRLLTLFAALFTRPGVRTKPGGAALPDGTIVRTPLELMAVLLDTTPDPG